MFEFSTKLINCFSIITKFFIKQKAVVIQQIPTKFSLSMKNYIYIYVYIKEEVLID